MEKIMVAGEQFDMRHAQRYVNCSNASFWETFMPNQDTVMVACLKPAVKKAGKKYHTLLVGINGKLLYCRHSTYRIMKMYSQSHFYGLRLSKCLAKYYGYTSFPYFGGAYSFVAAKNPYRGYSRTWICSRWFYKMHTCHGQTWVTFANQAQQQQVTVNFEMTASKMRWELGLIRFAIEQAQRLIREKQITNYPIDNMKCYHALNLPLLPLAEQPAILPAEKIRFLEEMYVARQPLDQAVAEGKLSTADVERYLAVLENELKPSRSA
ncbi:hypothetical protein [Loigolactobacillus jiayinensis]|uniref:Uncharacterized protein n=1 Tax=Loigolactobacillus jiayinensis TaxID=2486016 RepID=A0ABW1RCM7_9LACO|nr:hypothetical protein [Loigolactobacillus jiayinensis]